jgi:hypothetical protein
MVDELGHVLRRGRVLELRGRGRRRDRDVVAVAAVGRSLGGVQMLDDRRLHAGQRLDGPPRPGRGAGGQPLDAARRQRRGARAQLLALLGAADERRARRLRDRHGVGGMVEVRVADEDRLGPQPRQLGRRRGDVPRVRAARHPGVEQHDVPADGHREVRDAEPRHDHPVAPHRARARIDVPLAEVLPAQFDGRGRVRAGRDRLAAAGAVGHVGLGRRSADGAQQEDGRREAPERHAPSNTSRASTPRRS